MNKFIRFQKLIAFHSDDAAKTWYVGTDLGFFYTKEAGATWKIGTMNLGLPSVSVRVIKPVKDTGYVNHSNFRKGNVENQNGWFAMVTL
jgi:ligand-binding sensor domain-containing protein